MLPGQFFLPLFVVAADIYNDPLDLNIELGIGDYLGNGRDIGLDKCATWLPSGRCRHLRADNK